MWSGVGDGWMDGWMGDTPQTVMTTRAPAVLKTFREDRTVEDGQEIQRQRARAWGRQQASGYGNLTRCWGAEQSKQKQVSKVREWLQFAPHSSIFIAMILSNYEQKT